MHIQKNFALAFSVFSLAVFGVPLAIQVGRKETYANLGIALVIAMTYYFLIIIVSWLEDVPSQTRSVDMVTKFDFSGSRLLDDLSCESSLIMG